MRLIKPKPTPPQGFQGMELYYINYVINLRGKLDTKGRRNNA